MDITTLSELEVKALIYDRMELIEKAQADVRALQVQLGRLRDGNVNAEGEVSEGDNEDN